MMFIQRIIAAQFGVLFPSYSHHKVIGYANNTPFSFNFGLFCKAKSYKAGSSKTRAIKGLPTQQNPMSSGQKGTKSVFLNKLSKKSEKTPLSLKTNSNKSRNLGNLKDIGGNVYNNQPCRTRNEVIGYDLASNTSYAIYGRTTNGNISN